MSAQHTQERLAVENETNEDGRVYLTIKGKRLALGAVFNLQMRGNTLNDARRLAACWNACEGVPTEFLEEHPAPFSEMRAERDKLLADVMELERQRDAMLTALNAAKRLFDEALPKFNWGASALDANAIRLLNDVPLVVQEAIAKTGGAA